MLKVGKLDSDLLKSLIFDKIKYRNEDVKVHPGIGEDCAVIDYGDYDSEQANTVFEELCSKLVKTNDNRNGGETVDEQSAKLD